MNYEEFFIKAGIKSGPFDYQHREREVEQGLASPTKEVALNGC